MYVNKDIVKVFICFVGVFNFFNVTPISFVQNIFKFANIFFTLRTFVGRFDDGSLRFLIPFNCEDNRKMIWQVSFYYGWLKVIVACYTIGDNVVYGICWVSGYPCWFICQRNHIIAKHEIEKVLHIFICFKIQKGNVEISCKYYIFGIFRKYMFKISFTLIHITVRWPVDSIENNIFRFSAWYFNRERLNCITVYAQVFS